MFINIRIYGRTEVKKVTRIFTASTDGWRANDFRKHCANKGPTLCLVRSSQNYLAAAFTSISWYLLTDEYIEDPSAMVFALTNDLQVFKTENPERAVLHHEKQTISFPAALSIGYIIPEEGNGTCNTLGMRDDGGYGVPADVNGASILTGSNSTR